MLPVIRNVLLSYLSGGQYLENKSSTLERLDREGAGYSEGYHFFNGAARSKNVGSRELLKKLAWGRIHSEQDAGVQFNP